MPRGAGERGSSATAARKAPPRQGISTRARLPGSEATALLFDASVAMPLFVGVTLLALAGALLFAGRRNAEGILLVFFLALVALNFLGDAARIATGALLPARIALLAAAIDPLFLVLFVTAYPYRRRSRPIVALLALVAAGSVASLALVLAEGNRAVTVPLSAARVALLANLVVAYLAAWLLAARALASAPTPLLAKRVGWLVVAVGVAVLARIGFAAYELQLLPLFALSNVAWLAVTFGERALVVLAVGALAWPVAKRGAAPAEAGWDRPIRVAILASLAIVAVQFTVAVAGDLAGVRVASWGAVLFGMRWPIFAGLLVYALLAFDDVAFERRGARWLPAIVGALAAFAVALLARLALAPLVGGPAATALALAIALGALPLAVSAARSLARAVGVPFAGTDRRLELYRAALEAAWASGPPGADARERLERDRAHFGLSAQEAGALEHVVASGSRVRAPPLAPGDEPAPGLLVERLLGEGAHGRVFLARRFPTGERVVVKEYRTFEAGDREARQRLLAELRPLLALDHPNVVRVIDFTTAGGRHLLVMRHVDGGPLSRRLAEGPMPPREVAAMAACVLDALSAAHARGIVHRDVKPSNVLLARDGTAHLADFGIAVGTGSLADPRTTVSSLESLGAPVGTLSHMAPEQARGGPVDARTDLYSLGLVVYEALAGRPALDLRGRTLFDALALVADPGIDLSLVPPSWREWLARALAVEPSARWPSALAMRAALARISPVPGEEAPAHG